jgi:hypothetical protein
MLMCLACMAAAVPIAVSLCVLCCRSLRASQCAVCVLHTTRQCRLLPCHAHTVVLSHSRLANSSLTVYTLSLCAHKRSNPSSTLELSKLHFVSNELLMLATAVYDAATIYLRRGHHRLV